MTYQSKFLSQAQARGFIHQITHDNALDALLHEAEQKNQPIAAYIGFDCTATSLHVGSLMQIMLLRLWQQCGHKPIVLMGGGTTKVGDPSGKDAARAMLDDATIEANKIGIKQVFEKYLTFGNAPADAIMVDNADWLSDIKYLDFLRDYGRHFSVNRMLSMDSVKLRLERKQHLSFLEFNYMLLQAYDFVELFNRHQCRMQFGGSDQWGNIIMGVDLAGRLGTHAVFGLTTPLLTTASGAKMGKTASGAVWLNRDMLSAYDYWQYWRNAEDADVIRFFKLFTELEEAEIAPIEAAIATGDGASINQAKILLATLATALCHGQQAADEAAATAASIFSGAGVAENMPTLTLSAADAATLPTIAHLLAHLGIAESVGAAKRAIEKDKCIKINGATLTNPALTLAEALPTNGETTLSKGKKHHWRLVLKG